MAPTADPSFEVATIKPSKPDQPGKGFRVQGRRFSTLNTTLTDLVTFALWPPAQADRQRPRLGWAPTSTDLEGQPDLPGAPNDKQLKSMVQKLLAERFGLTFHRDKKELSVYALTAAKSGPKLTKSDSEQSLPGLFFRGLGVLTVQNATMLDFCGSCRPLSSTAPSSTRPPSQAAGNFNLKWTPDESQFSGMGVKVPPPTDAPNAPPPALHRHPGADRPQTRRHQGPRRDLRHRQGSQTLRQLAW